MYCGMRDRIAAISGAAECGQPFAAALCAFSCRVLERHQPGSTTFLKISRTRLDRFLAHRLAINPRAVKSLLAQGRVIVDGTPADDVQHMVEAFTRVVVDGETLQAKPAHYYQLHKPAGVVSATKDARHRTVMDLLSTEAPTDLHIAGRLDYNSTGLMLLTNDGRWSRRLSDPAFGIAKRYRVTLDKPMTSKVIASFATGIYFPYEKLTTRPVVVEVLSERCVELTLREGRYHQIKRMFGYFNIEVLTLHRFAMGGLMLDERLAPGQSRALSAVEMEALTRSGSG